MLTDRGTDGKNYIEPCNKIQNIFHETSYEYQSTLDDMQSTSTLTLAFILSSSPEPSGSECELIVYPCSGVRYYCRLSGFSLSLKKVRFCPLLLQMSPKFAFKGDKMSPKI